MTEALFILELQPHNAKDAHTDLKEPIQATRNRVGPDIVKWSPPHKRRFVEQECARQYCRSVDRKVSVADTSVLRGVLAGLKSTELGIQKTV